MKRIFFMFVAINFIIISETSANEWLDNTNIALDISSRVNYDFNIDKTSVSFFTGVDLIKVFSNNKGDWGTLLLQPYEKRTYIRSELVDSRMTYRNVNFNFTGLLQHKLNFRIGHFEIPFGLEQNINTNGTLLDYSHKQNLGLKADWGLSANGIISSFEYEFAIMQGSGNNWRTDEETHVFSGRVGHNANNFNLGFSIFSADLWVPGQLSSTQDVLSRSRYAVDFVWETYWMNILAEFSVGEDNDEYTHNELIEFDWLSNEEELLLYLQLSQFSTDDVITKRSSGSRIAIGARFEPSQSWQWDIQYLTGTSRAPQQEDLKMLTIQLRYRFNI